MRQTLNCAATGLLMMACIIGPTQASTTYLGEVNPTRQGLAHSLIGSLEIEAAAEQIGSAEPTILIAVNKIIRIGPRTSVKRPDRCKVIVNENIYYSEAITEKVARERLRAITDKPAWCRREREYFR